VEFLKMNDIRAGAEVHCRPVRPRLTWRRWLWISSPSRDPRRPWNGKSHRLDLHRHTRLLIWTLPGEIAGWENLMLNSYRFSRVYPDLISGPIHNTNTGPLHYDDLYGIF
jgi:hypothetical protein